ncbi:MAG: M23 family metallopeptidase [Nitratireductor sp.]|nr:M23 family metallopeptidase [Nitratireductor sp.]
MKRPAKNIEADFLGDLEPLSPRRNPAETDRRGISLRWFGGSVLTGLASVFLMGGALYAALDGRQNLAVPAQAYQRLSTEPAPDSARTEKSDRPVKTTASFDPANDDGKVFMVPTVSREGEQDVVKLKPFLYVSLPLAAIPRREFDYPRFDPLAIFSESGKPEPIAVSADQIYGADVEGEIALRLDPFPLGDPRITIIQRKTTSDIEAIVRNTAPTLDVGGTALTSVPYFDAARFSAEDSDVLSTPGLSITAENVSVASRVDEDSYAGIRYEERKARVKSELPIALVLQGEGMTQDDSIAFANAIASDLSSENFLGDDQLLLTFEVDPADGANTETLERVSVFRNARHMVTVVRKDNGLLAYAPPPDTALEAEERGPKPPALLAKNQLPNVYNAVYRAVLNEGISVETASDLVRIIAFDVDFRGTITAADTLDLFLSLEEGSNGPTDKAEILFAGLSLGDVNRQYYRFPDPETGVIDYYDETGKSAKQFLLRQPVPNGRFNNGFGMRRHPVTRVMKMHWGVDFSAPRGSPILAAGNGVVEKAGWAGGSGKRTIIRHTNGYETYYLHQSSFAKGIHPGVRVRQGQVIGYVGSTGLSTGPHLHYEVSVNGNKVNPLKIKLPRGKVFRGEELAAFEAERERIDALVAERRLAGASFASN